MVLGGTWWFLTADGGSWWNFVNLVASCWFLLVVGCFWFFIGGSSWFLVVLGGAW